MVITDIEFSKALGGTDASTAVSALTQAAYGNGDVLYQLIDYDQDAGDNQPVVYKPLTVTNVSYQLFDDGGTVRMKSVTGGVAATSASAALMPWFYDLLDSNNAPVRQIHQSLLLDRAGMDAAAAAIISGDWTTTAP